MDLALKFWFLTSIELYPGAFRNSQEIPCTSGGFEFMNVSNRFWDRSTIVFAHNVFATLVLLHSSFFMKTNKVGPTMSRLRNHKQILLLCRTMPSDTLAKK